MYKEFTLDDGRSIFFNVTDASYEQHPTDATLCVVRLHGSIFFIKETYANMKVYATGGTPA